MKRRLLAVLTCVVLGSGATIASTKSTDAGMLAHPYAQFGFETLRELHAAQPGNNVFLSPTSIALALAMASNGADGTTRQAILHTLHSEGQNLQAFNDANQMLVKQIAETTAVQLSTANAIWVQQKFPVNPELTKTLHASYSAEIQNLDFRAPASTKTINDWVAKHTNDRIQQIVDRLDPSTVVILTNAIAFKGKWTLPFDAKDTQQQDFQAAGNVTRKLPMMKHTAEYAYSNANGVEAIRLPYADRSFAMYVVLPKDAGQMQTFLQQLTPDSFSTLVSGLHSQKGTIELPRFEINYDTSLNGVLKKLGMSVAFTRNANFDNIHKAPPPLAISEVKHASFLKVDEEGTEAAAATSIGIRTMAVMRQPPPFHMIVDHPFFLAIRDERNGQLLFVGVIADPEKK